MKSKYIYIIMAILLLAGCTEEKEFPQVTPFLGFADQGITELDSRIDIVVDLPLEVNSVAAKYFGNSTPVNIQQVTENNQTFKRGTVSISREDLEILNAAGDAAYVHFEVNGNPADLSSTKVFMTNPLDISVPGKVIFNDQPRTVSYSVNPKYEVSNPSVSVQYIVNPNTSGSSYMDYPGNFQFGGDDITISGTDFSPSDTVMFRITASANGYSSRVESPVIVIEPLTFQNTLEASLANDSSWTVRTDKMLMYQEDYDAIVEKSRETTVSGTSLLYETVDILFYKDSAVTVNVVYKDVDGQDSIVVESFEGEYAEILYETLTVTKEALDLVQGAVVYAGAPTANLVFMENGDFMTDANTTLVATTSSMFNNKDVSAVKDFADAPPATAVVIGPSTTFDPSPGSYYAFKVDSGGSASYGIIRMIDGQSFEKPDSEGRTFSVEVVFGETY